MIKKHKKSLAAFFSLLFVLAATPLVSSALVAQKGDNIVIVEDVEGNFFGTGNLVIIKGTVNGDVFVAGNSINITGTVNGDVFAAGSSIDVAGTVKGSLRAMASSINIRGAVERNVMVGAANFIVDKNAFIGGHLTYAAASLILSGPVGGQIDGAGQSAVIDSSVGGDVSLYLNDRKSKLSISDSTVISGNLKYKAPSKAEIGESAQVLGETSFTPIDFSKAKVKEESQKSWKFFTGFVFIFKTVSFLSLLLFGLILIYLMPKVADKLRHTMAQKPWGNIGMGLVGMIVIPVLAIILLFTVIGIPLALIMLALYAIAVYVSKAVVGITLGRLIADRFGWKLHKILTLILGLLIFSIVSFVPFIGWAVCLLAVLWAFGAILRTVGIGLKSAR